MKEKESLTSKLIIEKYFPAKTVLERINEINVHSSKRIPTERLSFIKLRKGSNILLRKIVNWKCLTQSTKIILTSCTLYKHRA